MMGPLGFAPSRVSSPREGDTPRLFDDKDEKTPFTPVICSCSIHPEEMYATDKLRQHSAALVISLTRR